MGVFDWVFRKKRAALAGIPGPKPHVPLGSAGTFVLPMLRGRQPWEVCAALGERYGKICQVWFGPLPVLVLNDPDLVGKVLIGERDNFYKNTPIAALTPITTDLSPFVLNGAAWKAAREGDPFTQAWFEDWLTQRFGVLRDFAIQVADQVVGRQGLDLWQWGSRTTFDAFSMVLVGKTLGDAAYDAFMKMGDVGSFRIKTFLPKLPPPLPFGFYRARRTWSRIFLDLVKAARAAPDPANTDFIHTVLRRMPQLTDAHLAVIVGDVYFGGAYSAASALGANLYLNAAHPEQARAVQDPLRGKVDSRFTQAQLDAVEAVDFNLWESLRLLTPVPLFTRNVVKGRSVPFAGHDIPGNTLIFISNWPLQRSAAHWGDPLAFRPARWADGGMADNPIGSDWFFPFGRGPRMCMGLPFALFYLRTMTAVFHGRVRAATDGDFGMRFYFGVMVPKDITIGFERAPS